MTSFFFGFAFFSSASIGIDVGLGDLADTLLGLGGLAVGGISRELGFVCGSGDVRFVIIRFNGPSTTVNGFTAHGFMRICVNEATWRDSALVSI